MLAVGTQLLLPGIGSGIAGLIGKTAIGAKVFGGLAYAGSQLSAGVSTLTQFAGLAGKVGVSTPITAYGSTLAGEAFAAAGLGDVYGFASIASAGINGGFGSGNGFNGEQFATQATYAAAGLGASQIGGIGGFAFSTAIGSARQGHFVVQTPSFAGFALSLGLQPITVENHAAIQTQDAKKSAGRPVAGDEPRNGNGIQLASGENADQEGMTDEGMSFLDKLGMESMRLNPEQMSAARQKFRGYFIRGEGVQVFEFNGRTLVYTRETRYQHVRNGNPRVAHAERVGCEATRFWHSARNRNATSIHSSPGLRSSSPLSHRESSLQSCFQTGVHFRERDEMNVSFIISNSTRGLPFCHGKRLSDKTTLAQQ